MMGILLSGCGLVLCWPGFIVLFVVFSPGFGFDFFSTSPEIGWEERLHLRHNFFCVKWDVEP